MQQLSAGASFGAPTLHHVWIDYQKTGRLKESTRQNYEERLNVHLKDWLFLPITAITKDMVEERHRQVTLRGKSIANSVFRTLRALLTYAEHKYCDDDGEPILKRNPVKRLSEIRAWHREKRRTRVIRPQQMPAWFRAVYSVNNTTLRDVLVFILLTGVRSGEATSLTWSGVNLETGILFIPDTKNGTDFELPVSDFVLEMLHTRKIGAKSEYVFPGRQLDQPISLGYKMYSRICTDSGILFSIHDLRRTFTTIGDELEIKNEVIKGLVNHRPADVTEGYIIRSPERLRRASQRITNAILYWGGLRGKPS